MKRLIFFARDLEIGGVERALVNLCAALAEKYEVTLMLQETRGALLPELDGRVRLRRMPRCGLSVRPLRRAVNALLLGIWAAREAGRWDFSCAYCTDSLAGSRMARLASRNACLYIHNDYSLIYPEEKDFRSFFRALHAQRFRHLLFVSRESRAAFCARCPALAGKTAVIGNLVGAQRLRRLAAKSCPVRRRAGETVFLYLGRLEEEQKRLGRLLAAFDLARRERPGLRLLLVGDGPARPLCEKTIRALGLEDTVTLYPAQTNPYPFLAAADCLVLASDYEGFPVVCWEALALGRDVITCVPVSDDFLDLRGCATVCEKSAGSLAAAMAAYEPHLRAPLDTVTLDRRRLAALETLF